MKWIRRLLQKPHDIPHYMFTDGDGDWYAVGKNAEAVRVIEGRLPSLPDWWEERDIRAFRFMVRIAKMRKSRLRLYEAQE